MTRVRDDDWIILHTAASRTVQLALALVDAGFAAWTPTETRIRRVGRARDRQEYEAPIMPPFVFARYARLKELLALSHTPSLTYRVWDSELRRMVTKGYPSFTVMQRQGDFPRVADAHLDPLRAIEAQLRIAFARLLEAERRQGDLPVFDAGTVVRVTDGAFGGLDLVVTERNEGKLVKLSCDGWVHNLEISAWSLQEIKLNASQPEQG